MAAEKSEALVLRTIPFRETSLIVHLFTKERGLVHSVIRGAQSPKKGKAVIEHGQIVELNIYYKEERELQSASTPEIIEFFSEIRGDLIKCTTRDSAFEIIISIIKDSDEHPELYKFFKKFLLYLNKASADECFPGAFWLFIYRFLQHLGTAFEPIICISCGGFITETAELDIPQGGLFCSSCMRHKTSNHIPIEVLNFINSGRPTARELNRIFSKTELNNITNSLINFVRYHFDIKHTYKTVNFLLSII